MRASLKALNDVFFYFIFLQGKSSKHLADGYTVSRHIYLAYSSREHTVCGKFSKKKKSLDSLLRAGRGKKRIRIYPVVMGFSFFFVVIYHTYDDHGCGRLR